MSPLAQQVNPFLTLSAALSYIQRGWFIFPCWGVADGECLCSKRSECERPGKHPLGRLVPNGLLDATRDEDIVKSQFKQHPQANLAGRTGPESGFWVLDEDAYKGGSFSLEDLERRNGKLPFTVTSRTGSGGGSRHRLFNYPKGLHIPSRALPGVSGIDIKGAGGYIILPPSMHKSGGIYAWEDEDDARIVDAPEWLLNLVCAKPPTESKNPIPTGMKFDEETSNEICGRLFEKATQKIGWGEARHDTAVWFFIQCKDSAIPFEFAKGWIDPFLDLARESGAQRQVTGNELQRVLGWAYSKERRDPSPTVARKLAEMEPEEPQPDGIPTRIAPALQRGPDLEPTVKLPPTITSCPTVDFMQAFRERKENFTTSIPTGIPTLDEALKGGLCGRRVVVLVGPPGGCKTTFAIQVALARAVKLKKRCFIYGPDQGWFDIFERLIAAASVSDSTTDDRLIEISDDLHQHIVLVDETKPGASLESFCKMAVAEGAGSVVIDSAQTVLLLDGSDSERERIDQAMAHAKKTADSAAIPVFVVSQANRTSWAAKKKEDRSNPLSAGRGSAGIEHRAQVVLNFEKEPAKSELQKTHPTFTALATKVAGGRSDLSFRLQLDPTTWTLREIDPDHESPEEDLAKETKRLQKARNAQDRVIKELKRELDGLTASNLTQITGIHKQDILVALDLLRDAGRVFAEPNTGRGGGVRWKLAR